jgi:hypothetical protein
MNLKTVLAAGVAVMCFAATAANAATYTYVGSWTPSAGPGWTTNPLAYSGVGAAALLFGGSAADYAISTIDNNPLNINFQAHYDVIGYGSAILAQDFFRGVEGVTRYQDSYTGDLATATVSAYVNDFSNGGVNYAFTLAAVPEPASWALLIGGFGLTGAAMRRRRALVAA